MPSQMCDVLALVGSPACLAAGAAGSVVGAATSSLLAAVGDTFAQAAQSVLDAVFQAISATTTVNLHAPYVTRNAAALAAVAGVVVVGLLVVQVLAAAIRQEPRGLGRAVAGAGIAVLGAAAAGGVIQALLVAVDGVCNGIAALAGTSIQDAARRLLDATMLTQLATGGSGGPALMLLFGLLFILGGVLALGTLLVRQALIVVAVVLAPLAFAGGTARLTAGWLRRWAQVMLALILSKLAIVVVFVVAVGMLGDATGLGAMLSGLILLLLACLAPWACFKMLDFAGTPPATHVRSSTRLRRTPRIPPRRCSEPSAAPCAARPRQQGAAARDAPRNIPRQALRRRDPPGQGMGDATARHTGGPAPTTWTGRHEGHPTLPIGQTGG